jgi:hypothetical protein
MSGSVNVILHIRYRQNAAKTIWLCKISEQHKKKTITDITVPQLRKHLNNIYQCAQ